MDVPMGEKLPVPKPSPLKHSLRTSLISAFITAFLCLFFISGGRTTTDALVVGLAFALTGGAFTFWILRSGKVNTPRLILFIGMGLFFGIVFSIEHQVTRGSILLTNTIIANKDVPICPITIPFVVPPLFIRGEMVFPTSVKAVAGIGFIWLSFALLFGRGWCSWICFFGGMDQACAVAAKRARLKFGDLGRIGRLFPYAFLLFLILVALIALEPIYCAWFCPLRIIYDPPAVNTTLEWMPALIFVTGGLAFLIVGPFMTKKRMYCSFICPLLPANALVGLLSPFRVKIDREKCNDCGACVKLCESFAITDESVAKGQTNIECSRCGKCMDICPKQAIDYRIVGTNIGVRPVFVTLAVVFNLLIVSGYISTLVLYLLTGQMPKIF
jgi:NAD-dependent dihydropyrimidine dehydrogenase PreA subunit